MAKPKRITKQWAAELTLYRSVPVNVGGIWGTIRAGHNYWGPYGIRQVIHADAFSIIYFQKGDLWVQEVNNFRDDLRMSPAHKGTKGALGIANLMEFEVNLLLGIVAGSSVAGFLTVIEIDIFKFLLTNRDNFEKWYRMIKAILKARSILKTMAPILYEKVFDGFLKQLWSSTSSGMPAALSKPENAGKLTGLMIGKFGNKLMSIRFTVLGGIWIIFSTMATKLITSVPSAINIKAMEYKKIAQDLIDQLKEMDVSISQKDIQNIFREIEKNPREIKKVFSDLESVFKEVGFTTP